MNTRTVQLHLEGFGATPAEARAEVAVLSPVERLKRAAIVFGAFIAVEARVKEPMLPLRLFRKPAFTGVQLAALGVSASMFALFLYITFYLQNYLGHSPLEAVPVLHRRRRRAREGPLPPTRRRLRARRAGVSRHGVR